MTTTMRKRVVALALAAVTATGLSACGVGSQDGGDNSSSSADVRANSVPDLPGSADAPDPFELTGLNTVASVGDVDPVGEAPEPDLPVEFTDATGEDIEVTDISRIVALDLYGSLGKTISGLGLAGNMVGRGISSDDPIYEDLPVVTAQGHDINAEAVLQLDPSFVLVDTTVGPPEAIEQLREAGVSVAVIDPRRTRDSIEDDIALVANALGVKEQGKKLGGRAAADLDDAEAQIADLAPEKPLRMASLYLRGENGVFFILGEGSGADETISALHGEDAAIEQGVKNVAPANAEALAKLDPDVILVMSDGLDSAGGAEALAKRPGFAETTAGKNGRIVALPDSEAVTVGPQSGISFARFAQAVYLGDDVR